MTHYEKLDYDRLKMLEPELNEICDSKTKGFQIMSEAKFIENGEKNPRNNPWAPKSNINVVV